MISATTISENIACTDNPNKRNTFHNFMKKETFFYSAKIAIPAFSELPHGLFSEEIGEKLVLIEILLMFEYVFGIYISHFQNFVLNMFHLW